MVNPPIARSEDAAGQANGADISGDLALSASTEPSRAKLLAQVAMLEGKLLTLPAIEQAKGALMLTYGLTADAAFALLRFHSQSRNLKIRAIAAQLTTLMCNTPTRPVALAAFDRLLEQVGNSLQRGTESADADPDTPARSPRPVRGSGSKVPDDLPQLMLRAVAAAPPGITIAANSADLPLVYANEAFTDTTGYRIGDVLGRNCRFLQGADTDPRQVNAVGRALRSGQDISVVMRNYRSDGSAFWNEVSISPIRNRTDQITHYVGTQIEVNGPASHQHAQPSSR